MSVSLCVICDYCHESFEVDFDEEEVLEQIDDEDLLQEVNERGLKIEQSYSSEKDLTREEMIRQIQDFCPGDLERFLCDLSQVHYYDPERHQKIHDWINQKLK